MGYFLPYLPVKRDFRSHLAAKGKQIAGGSIFGRTRVKAN